MKIFLRLSAFCLLLFSFLGAHAAEVWHYTGAIGKSPVEMDIYYNSFYPREPYGAVYFDQNNRNPRSLPGGQLKDGKLEFTGKSYYYASVYEGSMHEEAVSLIFPGYSKDKQELKGKWKNPQTGEESDVVLNIRKPVSGKPVRALQSLDMPGYYFRADTKGVDVYSKKTNALVQTLDTGCGYDSVDCLDIIKDPDSKDLLKNITVIEISGTKEEDISTRDPADKRFYYYFLNPETNKFEIAFDGMAYGEDGVQFDPESKLFTLRADTQWAAHTTIFKVSGKGLTKVEESYKDSSPEEGKGLRCVGTFGKNPAVVYIRERTDGEFSAFYTCKNCQSVDAGQDVFDGVIKEDGTLSIGGSLGEGYESITFIFFDYEKNKFKELTGTWTISHFTGCGAEDTCDLPNPRFSVEKVVLQCKELEAYKNPDEDDSI